MSMHEKQKAEAVLRMKRMGIREDVVREFETSGTVMLCCDGQYHPTDAELSEEIRRFEREHNATVFLAVRMFHVLGTLDAMLFVGRYAEEWEMERANIKDGYAMSYCVNHDYPDCSEMGSIVFRVTKDGAIVREG